MYEKQALTKHYIPSHSVEILINMHKADSSEVMTQAEAIFPQHQQGVGTIVHSAKFAYCVSEHCGRSFEM